MRKKEWLWESRRRYPYSLISLTNVALSNPGRRISAFPYQFTLVMSDVFVAYEEVCGSRWRRTLLNDVGEHDIEQEVARVARGLLELIILGAPEEKPREANSPTHFGTLRQLFQSETFNSTSRDMVVPILMSRSLQAVELCARSQWKTCVRLTFGKCWVDVYYSGDITHFLLDSLSGWRYTAPDRGFTVGVLSPAPEGSQILFLFFEMFLLCTWSPLLK